MLAPLRKSLYKAVETGDVDKLNCLLASESYGKIPSSEREYLEKEAERLGIKVRRSEATLTWTPRMALNGSNPNQTLKLCSIWFLKSLHRRVQERSGMASIGYGRSIPAGAAML